MRVEPSLPSVLVLSASFFSGLIKHFMVPSYLPVGLADSIILMVPKVHVCHHPLPVLCFQTCVTWRWGFERTGVSSPGFLVFVQFTFTYVISL
jgi:hypothetical protein